VVETPQFAAKEGHTGILKELLAMPEADINQRDRSGATALWLATRRGHDYLAIQLLSQPDVDVNAIVDLHVLGRDRSTSLHHAVQRPSLPVLRSLIWTRQLIQTLPITRIGQHSVGQLRAET
jgi:ankyrin repeat protein